MPGAICKGTVLKKTLSAAEVVRCNHKKVITSREEKIEEKSLDKLQVSLARLLVYKDHPADVTLTGCLAPIFDR